MNRRAVLIGLLAAPAIVRASSLMAIRPYVPEMRLISGYDIYADEPFDWLAEVRAARQEAYGYFRCGYTSRFYGPGYGRPHVERWDGTSWRPTRDEAEVWRLERLAEREVSDLDFTDL